MLSARRLAELERQVAALRVRNSELSYHVRRARGGGASVRSRTSRRHLQASGAAGGAAAPDAGPAAASDGSGKRVGNQKIDSRATGNCYLLLMSFVTKLTFFSNWGKLIVTLTYDSGLVLNIF